MERKRIEPGPGQESVWDYPRPPRWEASEKRICVEFHGLILAETNRAIRVLETSHPPVYYLPPEEVKLEVLKSSRRRSFCEWKGQAAYYDLNWKDHFVPQIAWYYPEPNASFQCLKNYLAFYPSKVTKCSVDRKVVKAQEGDFYGGWITKDIVGPFKGGMGTMGW
ncbi:DUF427 domain-containing protein [Planctomycetales bacterium 10988]|nr:DUF427 domain-containing protein [Planctomycetales bacterium 10988]